MNIIVFRVSLIIGSLILNLFILILMELFILE